MNKIRVLHFGISAGMGGIETWMLRLATHLDWNRFQFDFLVWKDEQPCFKEELESLGGHFFYITSRRKNYFKNRKEVYELFQKEKFDILHCSLNTLSYITPCMAALKSNCKVVIHSRSSSAVSHITKFLHYMNAKRMPFDKICCVAVSQKAGEWLFGKKVPYIVLNNGVDTRRFQFSQSYRKKVREEFGISDQEMWIHVGAFRLEKNHEFIITLFYEYQKRYPDTVLMLVGDGPLKETITAQVKELGIEDKVIMTGVRADIERLLSAADKLVFPSIYEGYGNIVVEAETSGVRCVISDRITKDMQIRGCCDALSLDAPLEKWIEAMEKPVFYNREKSVELVEDAGFGVGEEILKWSHLYCNLIEEAYQCIK